MVMMQKRNGYEKSPAILLAMHQLFHKRKEAASEIVTYNFWANKFPVANLIMKSNLQSRRM